MLLLIRDYFIPNQTMLNSVFVVPLASINYHHMNEPNSLLVLLFVSSLDMVWNIKVIDDMILKHIAFVFLDMSLF